MRLTINKIQDLKTAGEKITMLTAYDYSTAKIVDEAGLEGGVVISETTRRIVNCGIPVMGHIGLTPQSINQLGGHRVQGKTTDTAKRLIEDAMALEQWNLSRCSWPG